MTGPFAVTAHAKNTDRLLCVNQEAQSAGLERGMSLSDAHALCPSLRSAPHHPKQTNISLADSAAGRAVIARGLHKTAVMDC